MKNFAGTTVASTVAIVIGLVASTQANAQTIENRHVYVAANQLADEVELIREVMGRSYDESPRIPVAGVTIFEVYFQVQTLLRQSNRFATEMTGAQLEALPPVPAGRISAADIYPLVQRALEMIRTVKAELGIAEQVQREQRDTPIVATGIFSVVVDTNRQLNLLMSNAIRPADVFAQLDLAINDLAAMLASRAGNTAIPDAPFVGSKRPTDVYARLLECIDIVAAIAPRAGVDVLTLSTRRNVPADVESGHTYDLAKILVADVALLAVELDVERADAVVRAGPAHTFPSHVFQHASILKMQLERLAASF